MGHLSMDLRKHLQHSATARRLTTVARRLTTVAKRLPMTLPLATPPPSLLSAQRTATSLHSLRLAHLITSPVVPPLHPLHICLPSSPSP
eukprot:912295-Rhodomonas_salina.1